MTEITKEQKAWAAAWVECWAELSEIETGATVTITGREGRQGYEYKYATLGDTLAAVVCVPQDEDAAEESGSSTAASESEQNDG